MIDMKQEKFFCLGTIRKLKDFFRKQGFNPGLLGILINPFYFARKGLYESIKYNSSFIYGNTLDVGCGSKPYQHLFDVSSYVGLDYDKDGTNKNPHADYMYDGNVLPFENNIFDSCICSQVFEHVFNPDQFLKEINRVLKSEGILLMTVPFVWDEHDQPYDFARYSSFGLRYLLENSGFEIIQQNKSVNDIRAVFQLLNAYIQKQLLKHNNRYLNLFLTVLFSSLFNILGAVLGWILPQNDDLYLDNIILAKKVSQ